MRNQCETLKNFEEWEVLAIGGDRKRMLLSLNESSWF